MQPNTAHSFIPVPSVLFLPPNRSIKNTQRRFLVNLKVPFVFRHDRENGSVLTPVGATGFDDLHVPLEIPVFNLSLQALVQMFAALLFAFTSTANVKNTIRRLGEMLHDTKVSIRKVVN